MALRKKSAPIGLPPIDLEAECTFFHRCDPERFPVAKNGAFVNSGDIRHVFGGVTDQTIGNWMRKSGFPQPRGKIGKARQWHLGEIARWAGLQLKVAIQKADAATASN